MKYPISLQKSAHLQLHNQNKHPGEKKGEYFSQEHTHTCSLARPASGQQHSVTTSQHFADEWLQQGPPAVGGTDANQHADDAQQDQGHPLTNSQKTCRNALHTANYCRTSHREERGGTRIWEEDTWLVSLTQTCNIDKVLHHTFFNLNCQ